MRATLENQAGVALFLLGRVAVSGDEGLIHLGKAHGRI